MKLQECVNSKTLMDRFVLICAFALVRPKSLMALSTPSWNVSQRQRGY